MHLRLDRDVLLAAVSYTTRALPARPQSPAQAGLLLTAAGDSVTFAAYDNATLLGSRATVTAEVTTEGTLLIGGHLLADVVKTLPGGQVTIVQEGERVRLRSGTSKFTLTVLDEQDYTPAPAAPHSAGVISADVFAEAVAQVALATAGPESALPTLTGVRVEIDGPKMTLAATDRFRLAVRELTWNPTDPALKVAFILPAKALTAAAKGLANDGAELTLGLVGTSTLTVSGASRSASMATIEGEYPQWRALLSGASTSTATVNAARLAEVLSRVSAVKGKSDPVLIAFSAETFTVTAGSGETGAEDELPGSYDGEDMTVGFNPEYLRDGLLAAGSDEVELHLNGPLRPVIVTVKGGGTQFRYLAMPVRLQG